MRIECTLPHASEDISGVAFAKTEHGTVVSVEDVPEPLVSRFLSIDGYREYQGDGAAGHKGGRKAAAKAEDKPAA